MLFQAFPLLSGSIRLMGDIGLEPMTSALSIRPAGSAEVPANAQKPAD